MRTHRLLALLGLIGLVGCPSEIPPPPPPPPPAAPTCESLLAGRSVREEQAVGELPAAAIATRGRLSGRDIALGASGRELWYGTEQTTVHAVLDGPDLPIGTRMFPVVDWSLSGFDEPPVVLALVAEGYGEACLFDGREPLALENADGSSGPPEATAFAATIALRYLRTCPSSPDECAVFGDPSAVQAVVDPAEPPGGFFVRPQDPVVAPEDLEYARTTPSARGEASGPYTVTRLVKLGNVHGWGVEVERAASEDGGHNYTRLFLKKRRTRVHAFDIDLGPNTVWLTAFLQGGDDNVTLWVLWPELGFTLSVHAKGDGAAVGPPVSLGLSPYYDMGAEGIDGVGLYPLFGGAAVGCVLWDPAQSRAVRYASADAEPAWLDVAPPPEFDPESGSATSFTEADGKLVPVPEP
jgi:hypothetical protein